MNVSVGGRINGPYMQEVVTYPSPRPYYNQPLIVQPQPQVVIVEDRYNNNVASTEAALCAWCCFMELLCCCLL